MRSEDDVLQYHRRFLEHSNPLRTAQTLSDEDRNAEFFQGFHPEDREVINDRLHAMKPNHPIDKPYDLEDTFTAARRYFSNAQFYRPLQRWRHDEECRRYDSRHDHDQYDLEARRDYDRRDRRWYDDRDDDHYDDQQDRETGTCVDATSTATTILETTAAMLTAVATCETATITSTADSLTSTFPATTANATAAAIKNRPHASRSPQPRLSAFSPMMIASLEISSDRCMDFQFMMRGIPPSTRCASAGSPM
jgi:hypothetical protein